jgi:hypothetical protein
MRSSVGWLRFVLEDILLATGTMNWFWISYVKFCASVALTACADSVNVRYVSVPALRDSPRLFLP